MSTSPRALTATKVSPPVAPGRYLSRARLLDRLDASIAAGSGFVLVSAPAGSGKSTLVNGWLGDRDATVGWLQIDEGDADPARFWTYATAAVEHGIPGLGDVVDAAMPAGIDAAVTALVNEIATATGEFVLVLDDYHLIDNPDVHRSVERLIALRPSNLAVVLSSRVDPPFRLGRLRVRNQIVEIRGDDLRFDVGEATWLLDADAAGLGPASVADLCARTEGWAAGLVLAGLSLRNDDDVDGFVTAFRGTDQLVADYLAEELLDSLPDDDRRRLLDVSVLDRMTGPLVDAIGGTDDGHAWLRALAAGNQLVIALDRTGTWFRFHHLLRDLLRLELDRRTPGRSRDLHAAAGVWHREHGDLQAAVEHLIRADRRAEAADLVAENATELLNRGRSYTVVRYLDRLSDLVDQHCGLAIVHGWVSFVTGRFAEAKRSLDVASRIDVEQIDAGLICALTAMIHLAEGDVSAGLAVVSDSPPASDPTHAMVLGGVRVMAGLHDAARPFLAQASEMADSEPDHFTAAVTPIFEAISELESGRTDTARALADAAIATADEHRIADAAQMALAHSVWARTGGSGDAAVAAARRGVELARRSPEAVMLTYALASAADVMLATGASDIADEAESMLAEARSIAGRGADLGIAGRYLTRVEARHGRAERPVVGLVEELTDREIAVLRYLPSRLSQREIATELYVSLNTVKTHCRAIYRKLGVDGRQAAVQAARDLDVL